MFPTPASKHRAAPRGSRKQTHASHQGVLMGGWQCRCRGWPTPHNRPSSTHPPHATKSQNIHIGGGEGQPSPEQCQARATPTAGSHTHSQPHDARLRRSRRVAVNSRCQQLQPLIPPEEQRAPMALPGGALVPGWPRPVPVDVSTLLPSTPARRVTCNPGGSCIAVSPDLGLLVVADLVRHRNPFCA